MLTPRHLYFKALQCLRQFAALRTRTDTTTSRAKAPELPSNYINQDRAPLYQLALSSPIKSRLLIARHLYKLRNFHSAAAIAKTCDFLSLTPKDAIFVIQCLASSNAGTEADYKLLAILRQNDFRFEERLIPSLCDRIRLSGFSVDQKLSLLRQLSSNTPQTAGETAQESIIWCEYKIKARAGIPFCIFDHAQRSGSKFFLRAIPQLKISGHHGFVVNRLQELYRDNGSEDFSVIAALAEHVPDWLSKNESVFRSVAHRHLNHPAALDVLGRLRRISPMEDLFFDCVTVQKSLFPTVSVFVQDGILRALIRNELIEEATSLTDAVYLPNTVLPRLNLAGYRFLCTDDYASAKDCFYEALEQDPSDNFAALGLRFALPRTNNDMTAILDVRDKIGYGTGSFGRTGICSEGGAPLAELTISLLMSGKHYTQGVSTKRYRWKALKQHFGSRFLNYELLPADATGKSLFVIGDDGVGDEIRAAQFYGQLLERFGRVTISCDPRLVNLFRASFPGISFIPVTRRHKGRQIAFRQNEQRLYGFTQRSAELLTDQCRPLLESSDFIILSQALFFSHFAGHLAKPKAGSYLLSIKGERLPKSDKLRVGLLWRSHFASTWRKLMYLRIQDFLPILSIEGIEFWSVQHAIDEEERRFCQQNNIRLIEDVDLFNDFESFATYLVSMDLLIGISSVPIELGAALGVPVWLLGFSPENYWLRTAGGIDEFDRFTMNSIVIGPRSEDFSAPRDACCMEVFEEVRRRLVQYRDSRDSRRTLHN